MSSQFETVRNVTAVAERIIASFTGNTAPDAVEVRKAEIMTLLEGKNKADSVEMLVQMILDLEKPKSKEGLTVEQVARAFMEAPELAILNWSQIALLVHRVLPDSKTSSKSISSYASKRKGEWNIVQREKFQFDPMAING